MSDYVNCLTTSHVKTTFLNEKITANNISTQKLCKKKNMKWKKETRRQFFSVSLDFRKRRFYLLKNTQEIFEEMDNVSFASTHYTF